MNVQQTIIKGIRELLFFHNYLVLPRFGGFVLKSAPSHFSVSGGQLLPASKTVSFNAQLKQNDGILAVWLEQQLSCAPAKALEHLHDFAEFCSSVLTARRRLSIDRLGFFYLDFENNICFEPQQDSNFLTTSFGLGPVSIRAFDQGVAELKRESVFVDRTFPKEAAFSPTSSVVKNYRRLVLPLVFSILFFSLLLLFVSNNRFNGPLSASLLGNKSTSLYRPFTYPDLVVVPNRHSTVTYVADANGIATLDLGDTKHVAVNVLASESTDASPMVHLRHAKAFEIVFGCFAVRQNANKMVAKLKDQRIPAQLRDRNEKGMYVVSDGNFASRQEAYLRLSELKEDFPKAWIKKVN